MSFTKTKLLALSALALSSILGTVAPVGAADNPAAAAHAEIVAYRLVNAKTMHLDTAASAQQYEAALKNLGCETRLDGHAGHFDLTYRCSQWQTAKFDSHDAAHKWQDWLASLGFEVSHQHQ
jgi:hypothetical protein